MTGPPHVDIDFDTHIVCSAHHRGHVHVDNKLSVKIANVRRSDRTLKLLLLLYRMGSTQLSLQMVLVIVVVWSSSSMQQSLDNASAFASEHHIKHASAIIQSPASEAV